MTAQEKEYAPTKDAEAANKQNQKEKEPTKGETQTMKTKILFTLILCTLFLITSVNAQTIEISPDAITGTDDIHYQADTAIFTDNLIDYTINVTASNILIDGNAYILENVTFILTDTKNVTFTNIYINNFNETTPGTKNAFNLTNSETTITNSTITGANTAIQTQAGNTTITANSISGNTVGISITNLINQTITNTTLTAYLNNFENNQNIQTSLIAGATDPTITFNNGTVGNYWNTYTGVDADINGIGDTPHNLTDTLTDPHPLMNRYPTPMIPEFPLWSIPIIAATIATVCIVYRKRIKTNIPL